MKQLFFILLISIISLGFIKANENDLSVVSPNGNIKASVILKNGRPFYFAEFKGSSVIKQSALGFKFKNKKALIDGFEIESSSKQSKDDTWEQVWGQQQFIHNNYNERTVNLVKKDNKNDKLVIVFRVFNDGIGFRYIIPTKSEYDSIIITDELTEFNIDTNYSAWWIPAYRDNRYEYLYKNSKITEIDTVHTPLTLEKDNAPVISIHEANLTKYASMTVANLGNGSLKCDLVPWSDGTKVKLKGDVVTPWRVIQIADYAGELLNSTIVLNLNEPNKLGKPEWLKPVKYMGIWWGMHIGKYTFWESDKQGATNNNAFKYIDFAKANGVDHLLIEGWNKGWTPAWYENLLHVFDFVKCADGFDINKVADYAKKNGVALIGYHETGSNLDNYLKQIDEGMALYKSLGIHSIKIGQVGSRLNLKEWHHGQFGVEYYRYVLEKAAEYEMTVNFHEPIKQTGLRRTLPNLLACEGARGQEYNAWSEGNPPEHLTILPFTRLLGGPMDFTPGIFKIKPTRVHTTLAKQLAVYITMYSPLQMMADLPENYNGHPAFKFLQDVPVEWKEMKVINGKIGDYLTIARKDKNSDDWYLGSVTDENARNINLSLDFLEKGKKYEAQIYKDASDACFDSNPEKIEIEIKKVKKGGNLMLYIAKGGGLAIRFKSL